MTNPAWVVLFTKIAGLVTDTGGKTSHPAVLAREFGIPAVIGTSVATQRIATGDRLRFTGPYGAFYLRRSERAILMIAGGSGIAPELAVLRELAAGGSAAAAKRSSLTIMPCSDTSTP